MNSTSIISLKNLGYFYHTFLKSPRGLRLETKKEVCISFQKIHSEVFPTHLYF